MTTNANNSGVEVFISQNVLKKVLHDNFPEIKKMINEVISLKEVVNSDEMKITDVMIKMDLDESDVSITFSEQENCFTIVIENYKFEIVGNFIAQKWFLSTEGSVLFDGVVRRIQIKFEMIEVMSKNKKNGKIPNLKAINTSFDLFDRDINVKITNSILKWIVEPIFNNNACGAQTFLLKKIEEQFETNKQGLLTKINQFANQQIEKFYQSPVKLPGPGTELLFSIASSQPIKFYEQNLQFYIEGLFTPINGFKKIKRTSYPQPDYLQINKDILKDDSTYSMVACLSNNFFMSFMDCLIDTGYQEEQEIPSGLPIEYLKLKLVDWEKKDVKIQPGAKIDTKLAIILFTKFDNQEISNELKVEATITITKIDQSIIQENKTTNSNQGQQNVNFKLGKILDQKIVGVELKPLREIVLKEMISSNIGGRELNQQIDLDKIITQDYQKIKKIGIDSNEGCFNIYLAIDI